LTSNTYLGNEYLNLIGDGELPPTIVCSTNALSESGVYKLGENKQYGYAWFNNTWTYDSYGRLQGHIRSMYVPFSESVTMTDTYSKTHVFKGPQLVFFAAGELRNTDVDITKITSIKVDMQAFEGCSRGAPSNRYTSGWTAQKPCLCMDRTIVKFGDTLWTGWSGGSDNCELFYKDYCAANPTLDECSCVVEAKEYGDTVECFGPKCSRDYQNLAYRPKASVACSSALCRKLLADGTQIGLVECGLTKYNVTTTDVTPDDSSTTIPPESNVTTITTEMWMLVGGAIGLFLILCYILYTSYS